MTESRRQIVIIRNESLVLFQKAGIDLGIRIDPDDGTLAGVFYRGKTKVIGGRNTGIPAEPLEMDPGWIYVEIKPPLESISLLWGRVDILKRKNILGI